MRNWLTAISQMKSSAAHLHRVFAALRRGDPHQPKHRCVGRAARTDARFSGPLAWSAAPVGGGHARAARALVTSRMRRTAGTHSASRPCSERQAAAGHDHRTSGYLDRVSGNIDVDDARASAGRALLDADPSAFGNAMGDQMSG